MDVKWLDSTVSLGSTQFDFYNLLFSVLTLLAGLWVANRLRHLLLARLSQAADLDKSTVYTIATLVFYSVIMVTVLISFSLLGFDITNLAIVAGALSVGIGFGLQDIAKNFISGLLLLFDRSTKVGDFIELTNSGLRGTVEQIRVRSTIVRTADELDVIVPNSQFISDQVVNWTMSSDFLRLHIPFAVAHGTDVTRLKEAVLSLTSSFHDVVPADREHNASLWFTAIAESSLNFELLVWVKGDATFNAMAKKSEFTYAIHQMLLDQGFRIPIPQRDIYIKSMPEKIG